MEEREQILEIHILRRHVPLRVAVLVLASAIVLTVYGALYFRQSIVYQILLPGEAERSVPFIFGAWPALEEPNFFHAVRSRMIREQADFVEADLSSMTLRIYKKGEVSKEARILAKGREGSWWETPAGLYKVEAKEKSHFSSFGRVYQPWSLAFQGNFFIHGWPKYRDGTPVPEGYSGGCIRLGDEDAREVFDMVDAGVPVLVFAEDFKADGFAYSQKVPSLGASAYLAADLGNNFIFVEKSSTALLPIASLTKLMTALVASEYVNVEKKVTIAKDMIVETSRPRLTAGEQATVLDLLYPLLMESSNEAAEAIASSIGKERFIALMNQKAKAIGMARTQFTDVSGSDAMNLATAQDLFLLAKYLFHNRRFILDVSAGKVDAKVYRTPVFADSENYNIFQNHPDFVGGKTGVSSAARETVMSIFETELNGTRRAVAVILLGSKNAASDAEKLFAWVKNNY